MKLKDLLISLKCGSEDIEIIGSTDKEITSLCYDNRKEIGEGTLFACFSGKSFDGHDFAGDVAQRGASCLVVSKSVTLPKGCDTTILKVSDVRYFFAHIAAAFYGHPADKMQVIGITGTKGKSTSAIMIQEIMEKAGKKCGLIGTIAIDTKGRKIESEHTTPEALELQGYFKEMVDNGCTAVVMEVSSLALKMHRTQGFLFDVALYTNLSPDHIGGNEHDSFEEYMQCKKMLFSQCKIAIGNKDDAYFDEMTKDCTCPVYSFSAEGDADFAAKDDNFYFESGHIGTRFTLSGKLNGEVSVALPGRFSIYNALTAMSATYFAGATFEDMKEVLKSITVRGRIEMVKVSDDFTLMIDYAHNAMSLRSLLTTLRAVKPTRLVTLFGCGGNRDRKRRFEMGEVSGELSDFTIITSDNPRFEEPEAILDDIETGIKPTGGTYIRISDRKEAIRYAIEHGQKGDIIVLAGKGQETYQEIKGVKYHMDERELIADILEEMK